ncbi:MAG TPA: ABC transporter ATP-binding protein [Polyangia bacterium]|jgi:ABC-type multidrug transport system ATPase subunit|nr:ABC transporter ATP-binding protein [Polyangia bacterium]
MSGAAPEAALTVRGLRKRFGRFEALRGLDLTVPRGSIFGLIGPNGAGKTTTFAIACGFLRPDAGELTLLGESGFVVRRLKGRLTAMPQDAALGGEMRCREHLLYFAALQGLHGAAAERAAEQALAEVGLLDRAASPARTLSHGMMRRLGIAQALLGSPELVLLDEPTNGLDPRHAHELRELLARHRGQRTLIISSHNLVELEQLCDHVAFIDQGAYVGGGAVEAITGRGEVIEVVLGEGAAPLAALRAAFGEAEVTWAEETRTVRVRFVPGPGRQAEDVMSEVLRVLLGEGARISAARRGTSLEKRFLELT